MVLLLLLLPLVSSLPPWGLSGEEVCERRNPDRQDERRCLALPCCHFNRDPFDREGFGLCWSSVGDGPCTGPGNSGEEVCERRNPDRRDERRCLALPCCHFNRDYGGCWSSVGDGPCTAPGISGEEVCQWRNPDRRDERRCLALPCCHFNRDPFDKEGFGLCWSSVGDGFCK